MFEELIKSAIEILNAKGYECYHETSLNGIEGITVPGKTKMFFPVINDNADMYAEYIISCIKDAETLHIDERKISPFLIRVAGNEELLEMVPHRFYNDLALIYYVIFSGGNLNIATSTITNANMKLYAENEEALFEKALQTAREELVISPMNAILPIGNAPGGLYVLSNKRNYRGSGCIIAALDMIPEDSWILPSSIHELIITPGGNEEQRDILTNLIRSVNETEVKDSEILSDHPYRISDFR